MLSHDPEMRPSAKQVLMSPHVRRWTMELHESQAGLYHQLQPLAVSLGVPTVPL